MFWEVEGPDDDDEDNFRKIMLRDKEGMMQYTELVNHLSSLKMIDHASERRCTVSEYDLFWKP